MEGLKLSFLFFSVFLISHVSLTPVSESKIKTLVLLDSWATNDTHEIFFDILRGIFIYIYIFSRKETRFDIRII